MAHDVVLALTGLVVGTLVGLTGMGGGALLTPALVLGFGVPPTAAVGSDLLVALAVKPVGAVVHHRAGSVRWDLVRYLLPTALPAAFGGAYLVAHFGNGEAVQSFLRIAIGVVLAAGVAAAVAQSVITRRRSSGGDRSTMAARPLVVRPVPTLLVGLLGGLAVGCTSVGSGSLIIVGLLMAYPRLAAKDLVGTDLAQAVPLVAVAAVGHALFGEIQVALVTALLIGAVPGAYLGARLCNRVPATVVKWVLSVVLVASAMQMWNVPREIMFATGLVTVVVGATYALRRPGPRPRPAVGGSSVGFGD